MNSDVAGHGGDGVGSAEAASAVVVSTGGLFAGPKGWRWRWLWWWQCGGGSDEGCGCGGNGDDWYTDEREWEQCQLKIKKEPTSLGVSTGVGGGCGGNGGDLELGERQGLVAVAAAVMVMGVTSVSPTTVVSESLPSPIVFISTSLSFALPLFVSPLFALPSSASSLFEFALPSCCRRVAVVVHRVVVIVRACLAVVVEPWSPHRCRGPLCRSRCWEGRRRVWDKTCAGGGLSCFKFELHELTCQCSHDHDTSNSNSNEAIAATKATQPRPTTTTGQMPIDHNNGEMPVDSDNEAIPINLRRRGDSDGEHGGGDFIIQVYVHKGKRGDVDVSSKLKRSWRAPRDGVEATVAATGLVHMGWSRGGSDEGWCHRQWDITRVRMRGGGW
ncbi:hypothetical protein EDB89DRAFT_1911945 [Lactarius sanguifluus]|nr:hypothetical protein EDB89DRAFT_1911945 [Lactarius sanguifluus]